MESIEGSLLCPIGVKRSSWEEVRLARDDRRAVAGKERLNLKLVESRTFDSRVVLMRFAR